MHPLIERIELLMKHENLNATKFSARLGYAKPEKIHRLFREKDVMPSIDIILDITNTFVYLNPTWLLKGDGDMIVKPSDMKGFYGKIPLKGSPSSHKLNEPSVIYSKNDTNPGDVVRLLASVIDDMHQRLLEVEKAQKNTRK